MEKFSISTVAISEVGCRPPYAKMMCYIALTSALVIVKVMYAESMIPLYQPAKRDGPGREEDATTRGSISRNASEADTDANAEQQRKLRIERLVTFFASVPDQGKQEAGEVGVCVCAS